MSEVNKGYESILNRSKDGKHIIVVLLGPKRKLLTNQTYEKILAGFKACNNTSPCDVLEVSKSEFDEKSRPRKDKSTRSPIF